VQDAQLIAAVLVGALVHGRPRLVGHGLVVGVHQIEPVGAHVTLRWVAERALDRRADRQHVALGVHERHHVARHLAERVEEGEIRAHAVRPRDGSGRDRRPVVAARVAVHAA
jgi:hypothetical protein